ncbi:MAG: DUF1778 domain-containing protein [Acidimicrobiales bacterium]
MAQAPEASTRRHRLEVRVTPEQGALIRQAADIEHESVTAFVLETVTERARNVLEARTTITLANQAFDRFYATLDEPAVPVPELVELFRAEPIPRG